MTALFPSTFGRIGAGTKVPSGAGNTLGAVSPRPVEEVRMPRGHCIECGAKCDAGSKRCWSCHLARRQKNNVPLTPPNPSGLCMCGCGQPTNIARKSDPRPATLAVKGTPLRYIKGHQQRPGLVEYTVDEETGCWNWIGYRNPNGYALKHHNGKQVPAHRYMWEKVNGPMPEGLEPDHLCRNRGCVNPDHVEPVTHTENVRRSRSTKLTVEKVREIRQKAGSVSYSQLSKAYGVKPQTICNIVRRHSWREVE